MPLGRRPDERQVAVLGQHDQVAAREQHLAVAIASTLPLELARVGVDGGQNRFVQAVDEAVVQHGAGEAVLHPGVAPDFPHGEAVAAFDSSITAAPAP